MNGDQDMSSDAPAPEGAGGRRRQAGADNHARYELMLERHLDGELGPMDRDELFEHLEYCDLCREVLEAEERLVDRLSRIPRLMAPSDLRAQILREVAREREEMMRPYDAEERHPGIPVGAGEEGEDEEGYFASSRSRRRTRRRGEAARYSAVAASAFLVIAAVTAFLTMDFSSVQPLVGVQKRARLLAAKAGDALVSFVRPPQHTGDTAEPVVAESVSLKSSPGTVVGQKAGADAAVELIGFVIGKGRSAASSIHELLEAVARAVPEPAEEATPVATAIVLRATDGNETLSFEPDEFGETLRQTARMRLGGEVTAEDRFVYQGHRFRCYTMRVPDGWDSSLARSLKDYRSVSDGSALEAIRGQAPLPGSADNLEFFAAPRHVLKNAVRSAEEPSAAGTAKQREVRIYVME